MDISLKAYGKINIGLDVTGKRADGYHILKTVFQTINVYDEVRIDYMPQALDAPDISVMCDSPYIPDGEENLAFRAAKAFKDKYLISGRIRIDIKKNIPAAAGMAGGSADAAAVLSGLTELFGRGKITQAEMDKLALTLGADVPFCLRRGTWFAEGIGEILTELKPLDEGFVVIVKPDFGISTAGSYKALDEIPNPLHPDMEGVLACIKKRDVFGAASRMGNILEIPALLHHPEISDIKEELLKGGAKGAVMTGSGPAVFGVFDAYGTSENAADMLRSNARIKEVLLTEFVH